jgi:hypothetical protein
VRSAPVTAVMGHRVVLIGGVASLGLRITIRLSSIKLSTSGPRHLGSIRGRLGQFVVSRADPKPILIRLDLASYQSANPPCHCARR